jgi:hypothetical protein
MRRLLALAVVLGALFALVVPASAIERNFAGSAQVDYHFVPTAHEARANPSAFDGATLEMSAKVAVDMSDALSANLKLCYGCHGFELDMAYFDYRVADELNFRMGRFSPSFGAFNLRHDPANHRLSDKPLPYDMGRMLRMRVWNQGILPSPFPDNGLEVNGTHWFGDGAQLDYAAYTVAGFRSATNAATDLDFTQSRGTYYVDNNARPTFGGRAGLTVKLGPSSEVTLGGSGMAGTYDPNNDLWYVILGADLTLRVDKTNFRLEYLARRTDFDTSDPTRFKYALAGPRSNFFVKDGAYLEVEAPLSPVVDIVGRVDGMRRSGNVEATSPLGRSSLVGRATLGVTYLIERGLRLKASSELWDFSDPDTTTGRSAEVTFHLAAVGSF